MAADPNKANRFVKALEMACSKNGVSKPPPPPTRARTPPRANPSMLVRQLQEEDTDTDNFSISRLTDDEHDATPDDASDFV